MTRTYTQLDFGAALQKLADDVAYLKQLIGSPSVAGVPSNPTFATVNVGGVVLTASPPGVVTNVQAVVGAFFSEIFADLSWDAAVVGEPATMFDVELALNLGGGNRTLVNVQRTGGENMHLAPLNPNTNYSVRITPFNRLGQPGPTSAWLDFATGEDATIPPAPIGVAIFRGATTVVVTFTGLTEAQAPDVANGNGLYEIEIDTANTFNTGNKRTTRSSAIVVAFNDIITEGNWYARVSAIDASGNQGPWSAIAGPATAGGVIDAMVVAGLSAAKITVGEMLGDRISTNTLHVNKLLDASVMTARTIEIGAGGQLKVGSPPTTGMYINDQGISLYAGGVRTVFLDAVTGSATFTGTVSGSTITGSTISGSDIVGGTIKTAASGQRVEIKGAAAQEISFYSGMAGEAFPGRIYSSSVVGIQGYLFIKPPVPAGGSDALGGVHIELRQGNVGNPNYRSVSVLGDDVYLAAASSVGTTAPAITERTNLWQLLDYETLDPYADWNDGGVFLYYGWYYTYGDRGWFNSTHGGGVHMDDGTWVKIYGGKWFKVPNGVIEAERVALNDGAGFYCRARTDDAQRMYYNSTWDGVWQAGYNCSTIQSIQHDTVESAGVGGSTVKSMNGAHNVWRDHDALFHWDLSDPKMKRSIKVGLGKKLGLAAVKGIAPIRFKWPTKMAVSGTQERLGFDASQLPIEVTTRRTVGRGDKQEEHLMVNSLGLLAMLWQAVQELSDQVDALSQRLQPQEG